MKRKKTMKLGLIAALSIMPFGWANAQTGCPDIRGQWFVAYNEVFGGDSIAGVGNAIVDADRIRYFGAESFLGFNRQFRLLGHYSVDQFCNIVWNFLADDGTSGVANGVIVESDLMVMIISIAGEGRSGGTDWRR